MFLGDLKTPISLKLLQNMLQDVSLGRPWDFFQDSVISLTVQYGTCVTHNSLYCIKINVFGRFVDINLFRTVTKYVAGRLIRTSLVLFQGSLITLRGANRHQICSFFEHCSKSL